MDKTAEVPANDCPTAPSTRFTVYTKVLHRACQNAGGVEKLAARLRVPVATLYRWLEGEAEPPTSVFLKAVDLVLPTWTPEDEALAQAIVERWPRKPAK
jgi:hypothetical protein